MKRKVSFEDVYGRTRYDVGELFIPLCSKEAYDSIMKSDRTFHLGRGYWCGQVEIRGLQRSWRKTVQDRFLIRVSSLF